jgi:hypothetical protein
MKPPLICTAATVNPGTVNPGSTIGRSGMTAIKVLDTKF